MKLKARESQQIASRCAEELISTFGEANLSKLPYDALLSEMSEMVEDIEDRIDKIITSKIESKEVIVEDPDRLWED